MRSYSIMECRNSRRRKRKIDTIGRTKEAARERTSCPSSHFYTLRSTATRYAPMTSTWGNEYASGGTRGKFPMIHAVKRGYARQDFRNAYGDRIIAHERNDVAVLVARAVVGGRRLHGKPRKIIIRAGCHPPVLRSTPIERRAEYTVPRRRRRCNPGSRCRN